MDGDEDKANDNGPHHDGPQDDGSAQDKPAESDGSRMQQHDEQAAGPAAEQLPVAVAQPADESRMNQIAAEQEAARGALGGPEQRPEWDVPGLTRMGPNANGFSFWQLDAPNHTTSELLASGFMDPAAGHIRHQDVLLVTTADGVLQRAMVMPVSGGVRFLPLA